MFIWRDAVDNLVRAAEIRAGAIEYDLIDTIIEIKVVRRVAEFAATV